MQVDNLVLVAQVAQVADQVERDVVDKGGVRAAELVAADNNAKTLGQNVPCALQLAKQASG